MHVNCTQIAKWLVAYDRISTGEWMYWNFHKKVKTNITCEVAQQYGTFFNNKKHINCCFKLCCKMCTLQCCKCNYSTICKQHQKNNFFLLVLNVNQIWKTFKMHLMSFINHHHTCPPSSQLIHYIQLLSFLTLICTDNKKKLGFNMGQIFETTFLNNLYWVGMVLHIILLILM